MADAEDAVQDGFVKFWRFGRDHCDDPVPYLFRAVQHSAIDLARRRERRRNREERAVKEASEPDPVAMFEDPFENQERRMMVEKALEKLSPEQREVLVMKIWGDLTFRQIGEALTISPDTAASRYRYALKALSKEIPEDWYHETHNG